MLWQAVHEREGKPLTPGQWIVHEMSVRSGGRSAGLSVGADIGCPPFHGEDCCCCCCENSPDAEAALCCALWLFVFEIGVMVMLGEFVRWAGRPAGTAFVGPAVAGGMPTPPAAGEDCCVKGRFLDDAVEPRKRGLGCAPCCFCCCW